MAIKDRLEEWQKQVNSCSHAVQRAVIATETIMHSMTAFEYCKRGEDMPEMYGGGDSCGHTVMDINWSEDNLELLESDNILHAPVGIHEAYAELSRLAFDKKFDESTMDPAYSKIIDFWQEAAPKQIAEACVPKGDNPYPKARPPSELFASRDFHLLTKVEMLKEAEAATLKAGFIWDAKSIARIEKQHKQTVGAALREGVPMPVRVLADYPDLARAIPQAEVTQFKTIGRMPSGEANLLQTSEGQLIERIATGKQKGWWKTIIGTTEYVGKTPERVVEIARERGAIIPTAKALPKAGDNPYPKARPLAPLTKKELEDKIADMKLRIDLEKDANRRLQYRSALRSYEERLKEVGE